MDVVVGVLAVLAALAIGVVAGLFVRGRVLGKKLQAAKTEAGRVVEEAQNRKKEILLEAKDEGLRIKQAAEQESRERRLEVQRLERRIAQKEENLDRKLESLERRERGLQTKERELDTLRTELEELKKREVTQLEAISGLTTAEAKDMLLKKVEAEIDQEATRRLWEAEQRINEEAAQKARMVISEAIERLSTDVVSEATTTVVPLPSDDMKGRLIGREGRNIRALENATGVDLIIDDTPEAVTLSGFDPVRREIARVALVKLIQDGRIHPARVEEMVEKARKEVEEEMRRAGEEAVYNAGVSGMHPEVVKLLGRLRYRYSYGQNVLQHSVEVALLASMMAAELGAKVQVAKTAGLLHDLGKALTHEVEGGHAEIGGDIARKYGIPKEVIDTIEAHHHDKEHISVEGFLVNAADAISGARPGARRDSLEHYIKRLQALEEVATSFKGVEKAYAIQAGREVRIMVKPEEIDDAEALKLARDIVKKIEDNLVYPGQIKVTVIRETRAIEYAK
ncbi:MAG: ribonuclease Y [Chloroflexi bacterium]|nr:ribonuclease Y [Chloroflexota bacterium]